MSPPYCENASSAPSLNPGRPSPYQAANALSASTPPPVIRTDRQRRNLGPAFRLDEVVTALGAAVAPMTALGVIGDATAHWSRLAGAGSTALRASRTLISRKRLASLLAPHRPRHATKYRSAYSSASRARPAFSCVQEMLNKRSRSPLN